MNRSETEILIRRIEPADAAAVSALCPQLGYERSPAAIQKWIEELNRHPRPQAAFVACAGEQVIGWVEVSIELRLQSPPRALIGGLVIQEDLRNRGIGRKLSVHAEDWAWRQGVNVVRVTSRSTREAAHRFYLRDGYREVKTSLVFEKSRPR